MTDPQTRVERPTALPGAVAGLATAGPADGDSGAAAGPAEPDTPARGRTGVSGQNEVGPAGAGSGPTSQTSGSTVDWEGVAGPDARTWTVVLPPLELLNANHRLHRMQAAKLTSDIREAAGWCTRAAKVPHLKRARIVAEVRFWDARKRDPANWAPSAKAGVDGVVDAGVLDDDDDRHLDGPDMRLGEPDRALASRGLAGHARLNLHITELPEETS